MYNLPPNIAVIIGVLRIHQFSGNKTAKKMRLLADQGARNNTLFIFFLGKLNNLRYAAQ